MTGDDAETGCARLVELGFEPAATWHLAGEWLGYRYVEGAGDRMASRFAVSNALYAFCDGNHVLYIGKTSQTLRKRLAGYCKPGSTQSTNRKCHALIKDAINAGKVIEVLAFAPPEDLMFRGFAINLAGGLEDTLIGHFAPPWNGGSKAVKVTESAEREAGQLAQDRVMDDALAEQPVEIARFTIPLTPTYFSKGIINPGQAVSVFFGEADSLLTVLFSDGTPAVTTRIDRRANTNGSVRLVGGNQAVARWFRRHFRPGDVVTARILGPYLIELMAAPITPEAAGAGGVS